MPKKKIKRTKWNISEEARAEHRRKTTEGMLEWHRRRTKEEKLASNAKHSATVADIKANNPKKMERWKKRMSRSKKRWWRNTPSEIIEEINKRRTASYMKTYASWSEERKEQRRKKISEGLYRSHNRIIVTRRRINDYCGVVSASEFMTI